MDDIIHALYNKKLTVRDSLIQELFDFAKEQGADYGLWIEEWEEAGRTDLIELSEELGLI